MKWILFIISFYFSVQSFAKVVRVAVIDTGIRSSVQNNAHLCESGHKSFIPGQGISDNHGHGTNISGLIVKNAGNSNFCLIIIKYYGKYSNNSAVTLISALKYAKTLNPDIITLSGGGLSPIPEEKIIIDKILNSGIILNVAAGNEFLNLDNDCDYFPACYDKRINVISAKDVRQSNRGKIVDVYIDGKDKEAFGVRLTGTSQSTAIFTGHLIKNLSKDRQKR